MVNLSNIISTLIPYVPYITETFVAIGTLVMAYITYRTLKEMRNEKKGRKILEITKRILVPFIDKLNVAIGELERGKYKWSNFISDMLKVKKLDVLSEDDKVIFDDFSKLHSNITIRIDEYNIAQNVLRESLKQLFDSISTPEFRNRCKELIQEWNKEMNQNLSFDELSIDLIIGYIIDNLQDMAYAYSYQHFWSKYSGELLAIRNENSIKEKIELVEKNTKELLTLAKKLKRRLEIIRDSYREEFKFTFEELRENPIY